MEILCLTSWETVKLFFKVIVSFYNPLAMYECFQLSTSSQHLLELEISTITLNDHTHMTLNIRMKGKKELSE